MRVLAVILVASAGLAGCLGTSQPATVPAVSAPALHLEAVVLSTHTQHGLLEMDGYVERDGQLWRPTPDQAANLSDAPVWSTAQPTEYDYTYTHNGPFEKGTSTGFTLGQYLAGRAAVAYACQGGVASYDVVGTKLVPDGLYTLWTGHAELQKGIVLKETDQAFAAGPHDGSENTFRADAQGEAKLHVAIDTCLPPTVLDAEGGGAMSYVALALHTDGRTWGAEPGPFGSATHIQMFGVVQAQA
jgi:hypothetical protein